MVEARRMIRDASESTHRLALLRSGLALSGANRLMDNRGVLIGEGDDGILADNPN